MTRLLILVLLFLPMVAGAVTPDEMLEDPALEARAREISQGLRCPVCQNESIDESNAELAHDLRVLLRERLVAGDSDEEAVQYIVDRYGEFVLLRPTASGINLILWLAGPILLILALSVGYMAVRARSRSAPQADLTDEEQARLKELTGG
ncbi:cytochrome c-type biogenesis protein CcmH [Pelagovum pacificum]|uniref:Cytochrome c-type biogenesis protein n=1 Tax=Pelagovum pacificum TaxID=2588711 RepID=A0A5C5GCB3_9RHOB|nr:cytochrome c-type biogenesis protein [Pelagovum pacificum]QQA44600.1 cytochrome c-type biogenesis protein CcmH [Pelagovum pacificum]TNY32288.1 cytochrome c-type biogenesis protein CcmH [Pelagovum pacificum]